MSLGGMRGLYGAPKIALCMNSFFSQHDVVAASMAYSSTLQACVNDELFPSLLALEPRTAQLSYETTLTHGYFDAPPARLTPSEAGR